MGGKHSNLGGKRIQIPNKIHPIAGRSAPFPIHLPMVERITDRKARLKTLGQHLTPLNITASRAKQSQLATNITLPQETQLGSHAHTITRERWDQFPQSPATCKKNSSMGFFIGITLRSFSLGFSLGSLVMGGKGMLYLRNWQAWRGRNLIGKGGTTPYGAKQSNKRWRIAEYF